MAVSSQEAFQAGSHNIIVQAHGDNVRVQVGLPHLKLVDVRMRLRSQPRREIDILNPAFEAVPLVGRVANLRLLHGWLDGSPRIAITALIGAGGSGKTRLALEFLKQLPAGWQGGFLAEEEANRFVGQQNLSDWSWQKPTFIVVDYAAFMRNILSRWFSELADHSLSDYPLRILLLERHAETASGWYHDLADGTWHGQVVRDLFSPFEPMRVAAINEPSQRRQVLESGWRAVVALDPPGKLAPDLPPPGEDAWFDERLAAEQWADPLILLMAGLCAASKGLNGALELSRPDLAKQLAIRERDRIRKGGKDAAAGDLLAHLYAALTLCGGFDEKQSIEVAEQEFAAMHRQYPGGAGQAAADLFELSGAKERLPPLVPDLLGEALLPVTFAEKGPEVTARLARVDAWQVARTLIRCVQDFGPAGEHWPIEWLRSMIDVGRNKGGGPLMLAIENNLPSNTVILRDLAVEVTQVILDKLVLPDSQEALAFLAYLWDALGRRQMDAGHSEAALASLSEAVRRRSILLELDRRAYLGDLAGSLDSLANAQREANQVSQAFSSLAESMRMRRELADFGAAEDLRALARSLNNASVHYAGVDQFAEALASISEAVQIHRTLAANETSEFSREYLAGSLHNQSYYQLKNSDVSGALDSIMECVRLRRSIQATNPDAYLPNFAGSLVLLAYLQMEAGQNEAALASAEEAVYGYRKLADIHSDAFLPFLAASLDAYGRAHHYLNNNFQALASIAEAVRIKRPLTSEASPRCFLPPSNLAELLMKQAIAQTTMGMTAEALESITEAVAYYRELAEKDPNAVSNLARLLENQATAQTAMGMTAEALESLTEAVVRYRALAENEPKAYLFKLAILISTLGDYLARAGRVPEARDAAEESLRLFAPFFLRDPSVFDKFAVRPYATYLVRCQALEAGADVALLSFYAQKLGRDKMIDAAHIAQQTVAVLGPLLPLAAAGAAAQMAQGFFKQPGARLFDWLVSKLKGTSTGAALDRAVSEPENPRRLEVLRLEIEDLADKDSTFREELVGILKEIAAEGGTVTSTQTLNQTGDNNKAAQASGNDINTNIA